MTSKYSKNVLKKIREDDFIEYFLFPKIDGGDDSNTEIELNSQLNHLNTIVDEFCCGYIWHKDSFQLKLRLTNSNVLEKFDGLLYDTLPTHFYGVTHYGDNIQDEWFIVALLFEISKRVTDMIVRVIDSDGEFLLIEAADYLPSWANPNTCEQRVYIKNGALHLIENLNDNSNVEDLITVPEAISMVRENPDKYKGTSDIQNSLFGRIRDYPGNIDDSQHKAIVYVPLGVAALLKHKPSLISAACHAFCNRDMIDTKACKAMRFFPPENRVYTLVTFTKCLYAMLVQNNYNPDRRTGWNLPIITDSKYKSHLLGVKIASGFEILASNSKMNAQKPIEEDKQWLNYIESLKIKNYFQDNLEGSKDYQSLLNVAKEYYIENRDTMSFTSQIGQEILNLYKSLDYTIDDVSNDNIELENDDSWMNISPEALDEMLKSRYGVTQLHSIQNGNQLSTQLMEFFDKKSEFNGIEIQSSASKESPFGSKGGGKNPMQNLVNNNNIQSTSSHNDDDSKIDFDPEGFQNHVQNLVDLIIPEDDWESNSDMSGYEDDDDIDQTISDMPKSKLNIKMYMEQMDLELAKTTIGQSFPKSMKSQNRTNEFDDIENFKPVDIDMNVLKNMVESYKSELGGSGPASNLLSSMGIGLKIEDKTNEIDDEFVTQGTQV